MLYTLHYLIIIELPKHILYSTHQPVIIPVLKTSWLEHFQVKLFPSLSQRGTLLLMTSFMNDTILKGFHTIFVNIYWFHVLCFELPRDRILFQKTSWLVHFQVFCNLYWMRNIYYYQFHVGSFNSIPIVVSLLSLHYL